MARLILKSPYLKPGGSKQPGGYLKYIATREGVEMAEDTSRHLPATVQQQKQITKLLQQYPDSKDSHEHEDYVATEIDIPETVPEADAYTESSESFDSSAVQSAEGTPEEMPPLRHCRPVCRLLTGGRMNIGLLG